MENNQIANFRIIEKLGEGGMGVVYKAVDVQLDRPVAIKMLNPELARNPELVQRFRTEAKAQANLNNTNLATLYTFLVIEGNAFMVMEYVEGETFEQIIRRSGPMGPQDAIPWFKQALLGIGAAHRMGIIHRDIKPSNLMLNRQGIVKVMDFGIAKALGTKGMTRTGMQMGTVSYMSPEQIQNRVVDVRSDIYALGITLYEMLSGHVPFESDSDFQVMHDHVATAPPPPSRYYPYAPRELERVVLKALEKDPDNRFQTVEEFGFALEHPETVAAPVYSEPVPLAAMRPTTIDVRADMGRTSLPTGAAAAPAPAPLQMPSPAERVEKKAVPAGGLWKAKYLIAAGIMVVFAGSLAVLLWSNSNNKTAKPPAAAQTAPVSPAPGAGTAPSDSSADIPVASGGGESQGSGTKTLSSETTDTPAVVSAKRQVRTSPVPTAPAGPTAAERYQQQQQRLLAQQQADQQARELAHQQQEQQYQQQLAQQQAQQRAQQEAQQRAAQRQQQEGQSFVVKHRHVVMNGFQSYTYFCAGVLNVRQDGTVSYKCSVTNDPSGRCDQVVFPSGTIRQAKMKNAGELHLGTSSLGNWDFFDHNVAGSVANAYQLIAPLAR